MKKKKFLPVLLYHYLLKKKKKKKKEKEKEKKEGAKFLRNFLPTCQCRAFWFVLISVWKQPLFSLYRSQRHSLSLSVRVRDKDDLVVKIVCHLVGWLAKNQAPSLAVIVLIRNQYTKVVSSTTTDLLLLFLFLFLCWIFGSSIRATRFFLKLKNEAKKNGAHMQRHPVITSK